MDCSNDFIATESQMTKNLVSQERTCWILSKTDIIWYKFPYPPQPLTHTDNNSKWIANQGIDKIHKTGNSCDNIFQCLPSFLCITYNGIHMSFNTYEKKIVIKTKKNMWEILKKADLQGYAKLQYQTNGFFNNISGFFVVVFFA